MLALEVEYLTGRAVATERDDYQAAEWPPHPGRLFMALVAAHGGRDPGDGVERAALEWLEALPPPDLTASAAARRDVRTYYVPANDPAGIEILPERRARSDRTFPSVTPEIPVVVFTWREADPGSVALHRPALERLAASVTYLGHSSSLVRVALRDDPPAATFRPSDRGTLVLRVATPGRLAELRADHAAGRRPSPGSYTGYLEAGASAGSPETPALSGFDRPIAFGLQGPGSLPLFAAERLTRAVRDALMSLAEQPPREVLSGHARDGSPSTRDHVAFLPLAFVGYRHADGEIKGFAIAPPRGCGGDDRVHVLRAAGRLRQLRLGPLGVCEVVPADDRAMIHSLRVEAYEGPSRSWSTVTPMVLDRFCGEGPGLEAAVVAAACRRIGLPEPTSVEVSRYSRLRGVPASPEFAARSRPGAAARPRRHVRLKFDRPVRGPILLGAGRYLGLGLCRAESDPGLPGAMP
jgi:CRISPR-associated protein Csb2